MFGYDPGHSGYVDQVVVPHPVQGKLLWSHKFGPVFSSPVAGLDMLFIASADGYLYALKQASGALVWRTRLGNYLTDSTPALEGQVLFVAVHSSSLEALDAHTGQIYWTFETNEKIQAPLLAVGKRVLLASRTTLWALDATSGHLLWKFHRSVGAWPTTGSPTVADNTVYFGLGSGTQFWALDLADGHTLWSFDTGDRITSTALVAGDSVYVATWRGNIFALERVNGKKRWSYALNTSHSQSVVDGVGGSMALANGRLYAGDYRGSILSIDASRGSLIWRYATGAQILATPLVAAGLVYIGSGDGYFYALDTHSGRPAWRYQTGEIRGSASLANGHLFVGSLNGTIYAFA
jgi:outer membrane protein assembly factor BamB